MIKLNDYVNTSGEFRLFKYKIKNLKFKEYLKINLKTNDLIILEEDGFVDGFINQSSINLIEKPDEEKILFSYLESFNFYTNDAIIQPLVGESNEFYIFSFKDRENLNLSVDEFYYLDSNSNVEYDYSDDSVDAENYLFQVSFSNVKNLKNYDPNKLEYKFFDEINKNPTKKVTLTVPNSILISDIVFKGRIEQNNLQIENNVIANFKTNDDVSFYPFVLHPISVQKNYVLWFSHTLLMFENLRDYMFKKRELIWKDFYENFLKVNFTYVDGVQGLEHFSNDLLHKKVFFVTQTLTSNFSNMDEPKRKEFKQKVYNGNDPKQYCDFQIHSLLDSLTNEKLRSIVRIIILMLSKHISSSFCFKGGLTEEHELYLPFYLEKTVDNSYAIKSNYFFFDDKEGEWKPKKNILNEHNTFLLHDKVIQMPIILEKINEVNISNSPLDFNTSNSHNFNYLFWNPSYSKFLSNYFNILNPEVEFRTVKSHVVELPVKSKAPDWRVRYDKQPVREIKILEYGKDSNVISVGTKPIFGSDLRTWYEIWDFLEKQSDETLKEILKNAPSGRYIINKAYTEKEAEVHRIDFKAEYHNPPIHIGRGPGGGKGWSLYFSKEVAKFPIQYEEQIPSGEIPKVNYVFKSEHDFTEIKKDKQNQFIDIVFEISEKNFILEQITLKSIFADRITVRIDGYLEKNYKLNYEDNKLISETTLII